MKTTQTEVNAFARKMGFGKADTLVIDEEMAIIRHISYGYRKITTDEYVPNAYRNNFGWKNTYYQPAKTTVSVPEDVLSAGEAFSKRAVAGRSNKSRNRLITESNRTPIFRVWRDPDTRRIVGCFTDERDEERDNG